jgi:hypothetical protein
MRWVLLRILDMEQDTTLRGILTYGMLRLPIGNVTEHTRGGYNVFILVFASS